MPAHADLADSASTRRVSRAINNWAPHQFLRSLISLFLRQIFSPQLILYWKYIFTKMFLHNINWIMTVITNKRRLHSFIFTLVHISPNLSVAMKSHLAFPYVVVRVEKLKSTFATPHFFNPRCIELISIRAMIWLYSRHIVQQIKWQKVSPFS